MRKAEFESERARLIKAYFAAKDYAALRSITDQLIQLYDTYIKGIRFALAKNLQRIEELEEKR